MKNLHPRLVLLLAPLGLAACCSPSQPEQGKPAATANTLSSAPATTQPAASEPVATQPAKPEKPFMFNEASLPAGFPPPGPVGKVIVKQYPASRLARVDSASLGSNSQNKLFGTLFNHIKENDIPMTAPVEMVYQPIDQPQGKPASMAFLYRTTNVTPSKQTPNVKVIDVPPVTVASISIRAGYNDKNHAAAVARLKAWLEENKDQYEPAGPARFLGYNSPFVPPFLQMGETQIPIQRVTPQK